MKRILVVDDDLDVVTLEKKILVSEGYEVHSAQSGQQAVVLLGQNKYNVILLDVMMPGMNGIEVSRVIREAADRKSIPVVFVTAKDDAETMKAGFKAGGPFSYPSPSPPGNWFRSSRRWRTDRSKSRGEGDQAGFFILPRHASIRFMPTAITKSVVAFVFSILMVQGIGLVDHFTGYDLGFFVFYLIPITYASWFCGRWQGMVVSALAAVVWYLADYVSGHGYPSAWYGIWNACIRLISFAVLVHIVYRVRALLQIEKQLVSQLKLALGQVKELSGLLPICASCKKVRDDQGYWEQIESYIKQRTKADFSHGLCPECSQKLYPNRPSKPPQDQAESQ